MKNTNIDTSGNGRYPEKAPFFRSSVLPFFRSSVLPLGDYRACCKTRLVLHRRKLRFTLIALICTLALSACFSPWTGEDGLGEVRIGPGGGTARTIVPGDPERAEMTYKVHFSGPGGSFDREFGPAGGVERLSPGTWHLTVKAYNNEPRLRGIAQETINVSADGSHTVVLESCIGIKTEADLQAALGNVGLGTFGHDTASGKGDLLVLENDIMLMGAFSMNTGTTPPTPVTIIAEPGTSRTIAGDSSVSKTIIIPSGQTLYLGRTGETGTLTIDCNNNTPAAIYASGGTRVKAGNTHFARLPVTVTFHNNDTTSGFTSQPIGSSPPVPPSYASHYFVGWYTQAAGGTQIDWSTFNPSEDVDLYAHWIKDSIANAAEWKEAITAVNGSPGAYSFAITSSFGLDAAGTGPVNNPDPVSGVNLTLTQTGSQTITLNNGQQGSLLRVASGVTLTLSSGLTLAGKADSSNNNAALVNVLFGGTFTLQNGKIIGNTNTASGGGVSSTGSFNMSSGSSIEGCRAASGGGVYVGGGTFDFNGGTIGGAATDKNTANQGGGVFVYTGTFTMSTVARIQNNTTTTPSAGTNNGGGVYVAGGFFTMSGGTIEGDGSTPNAYSGGGVYVDGGTFTMDNSGAVIQNNVAGTGTYGNGGGVYVTGAAGNFNMSAGRISGNNTNAGSSFGGGGVYVASSGTFTMSGSAALQNNRAGSGTGTGGGVHVGPNGTFNMKGGSITGDGSTPNAGSGGAVYVNSSLGFTMSGGTIGGINSTDGNVANNGGGVSVGAGIFTMTTADGAARIRNNTASASGGGVSVSGMSSGTFDMQDGEISANTATSGGGVGASNTARFTMSGGIIGGTAPGDGNTASIYGGGVYMSASDFEMSGPAAICYNTSNNEGGGVYFIADSTKLFTMKGSSKIESNEATSSGGGVWISGKLDFGSPAIAGSSGSIKNNLPAGNNVYLNSGGSITGNGAGTYSPPCAAW